ncbi:MAG TPA: glycosyltransferase family 4 protein [Humisphaera sp.]
MNLVTNQPPTATDPAPPGRRLRVLVNVYAASPARGSEPGVGWQVTSALARWNDVTVLCAPGTPGPEHSVFKEEIDRHVAAHGPVPGLTIHYVPRPPLSEWFQKERELFRRTVYYAGYKAWQRAALREARRLHAMRPFDVVHQLAMTGFREPGYLWKLPGVPFVWGPVGGAANIPAAYFPLMGAIDRAFYAVRNLSNELQKRAAIRCRRAAARASHLWAIGDQNKAMIEGIWGRPAEMLIESGTVPRPEARVRRRVPGTPLRVVWSGLHIGRKALPLLLRAMARLAPGTPVEATVLGGGPLTAAWQAEAAALGLSDHVRFPGKLPQADALRHVNEADVLAFTSVQEGTPHAVLEALSLGVPVICHDACGMGVAVDASCGIKLPMTDIGTSVDGFAAALKRLADEPELVGRLSAGAIARSDALSWASKARRIDEVYRHLAGNMAD